MTKKIVRVKKISFCDGVNVFKQRLIELNVENKADLSLDGNVLHDTPTALAWDEIVEGPVDRQRLMLKTLRKICSDLGWSPVDYGLGANFLPADGGAGEQFVFEVLGEHALKEKKAEQAADGQKPGTWGSDAHVDKAPPIS